MHVTADPNSKDHWTYHFENPVTVTLNGEIIKGCSEADDVLGYVIVGRRKENVIGHTPCPCGEYIWQDILFGTVQIIGERLP